ncbi:MAG TPA: hypothetical protein VMX38_06805 [Verrucomicrobiae bacterium]|nr:hypothetical protein [Verrucomicrobiae bacterium]
MAGTPQQSPQLQAKSLAQFLEGSPPYALEAIADLARQAGANYVLASPELQIHCTSKRCNGIRVFHTSNDFAYLVFDKWTFHYVTYTCRNCQDSQKIYSLAVQMAKNGRSGLAQKFGEIPTFGPPTPARVITLIGPDSEMFLRGRRAENHGLGIGAYAYYRRVVENQKGRIIAEMGRVAARLGAEESVIDSFSRAAKESQFSTAIDLVKAGIPKSLLIEAHNPLTLLHTALSEGLHDRSDEECLMLATSIRLILTELAERISQALKDDTELKQSVSKLLNRNNTQSREK